MNGGSPPTAPNARAGLFTPPGITRLARAKASWLRGGGTRAGTAGVDVVSGLFGMCVGGDPDVYRSTVGRLALSSSCRQPCSATAPRRGHGR